MGKNPTQTTTITIYNQSHSPRMQETLLNNLRMQCMSMRRHINKTQPKDFIKNIKTPKLKKHKTKNKNLGLKCMKCMKNEKKKRLRAHTKGLKLGLGQNLEGMKDFSEKERFGSREKRERERERERSKYLSDK